MTTPATERFTIEWGKLMPAKTEPFRVFQVSQATIAVGEDGILNTLPINAATLVASASFVEQPLVYTTDEADDKRDEIVDKGGVQTPAGGIVDALHQ